MSLLLVVVNVGVLCVGVVNLGVRIMLVSVFDVERCCCILVVRCLLLLLLSTVVVCGSLLLGVFFLLLLVLLLSVAAITFSIFYEHCLSQSMFL